MSIDISKETLYTLTEATKLLPLLNRRPISANAMWRWCSKGIQGVYLEHVRIGVRICTSAEAMNRFANALAEAARERLAPPPNLYRPTNTPRARRARPLKNDAWLAQRQREIREAEEELERAGL